MPVQGGLLVIFQVVERPVLKAVTIIGADNVGAKQVKHECGLKPGDGADPFDVEQGRAKIERYYQSEGYPNVRVTVLEGNKPGDLYATYMIDEGPRQKILWVRFVGNTIVSGAAAANPHQLAAPLFLALQGGSGPQADRRRRGPAHGLLPRLGLLSRPRGPRAGIQRGRSWLTLTFVIDEGPRYAIRNVSFIGNTKLTSASWRRS